MFKYINQLFNYFAFFAVECCMHFSLPVLIYLKSGGPIVKCNFPVAVSICQTSCCSQIRMFCLQDRFCHLEKLCKFNFTFPAWKRNFVKTVSLVLHAVQLCVVLSQIFQLKVISRGYFIIQSWKDHGSVMEFYCQCESCRNLFVASLCQLKYISFQAPKRDDYAFSNC